MDVLGEIDITESCSGEGQSSISPTTRTYWSPVSDMRTALAVPDHLRSDCIDSPRTVNVLRGLHRKLARVHRRSPYSARLKSIRYRTMRSQCLRRTVPPEPVALTIDPAGRPCVACCSRSANRGAVARSSRYTSSTSAFSFTWQVGVDRLEP